MPSEGLTTVKTGPNGSLVGTGRMHVTIDLDDGTRIAFVAQRLEIARPEIRYRVRGPLGGDEREELAYGGITRVELQGIEATNGAADAVTMSLPPD